MKKTLLTIMTMALVTLSALADGKQDAINFFNNYVKAANSYDPVVATMYSPNAKIIREVIKPDGTLVDVATDTATYIRQMKIGQAGAKLKGYKNTYTNITATALPDGSYKVSSLRQPANETYKLKTYMIVRKQTDGKWLITEEMMQTKVQTFLKYQK
ncbi:MAG: hypothetical protein NC334_08640 [Bacteroides sp.]|nr:hypothetical protein [Bacteroides sp.]